MINHTKVSAVAHDGDSTKVQGEDWNDDHEITDAAAVRTALGLATIATSGSGADLTDATVTTAKLATIAATTILGNNTGSTAAVTALTAANVRAMLGGNLLGIQRVDASGTYTPTTGTRTVIWEQVGGGGGGGGVNMNGGGAGGNSGFYIRHSITNAAGITGGTSTIGAAGAAGTSGGGNGGTGGDTSVVIDGVTYTAKGGTGGNGSPNAGSGGQIPLAPASGSTSGTHVLRFGPGSPGFRSGTSFTIGGAGGESPLGSAGSPAFIEGGKAGTFGGGGGGGSGDGFNVAGGAGGAGLVIFYEFS